MKNQGTVSLIHSLHWLGVLALGAVLTACGGGGGGDTGGGSTDTTPRYTVGGTVTGLTAGSVVLQNNGGDDLTLSADGSFTFATALNDGSAYKVTVLTQPLGLTCSVSTGVGTVSGNDVANVVVVCATDAYAVGGSVSGLAGTVVLRNNSGDDLTVDADGSFTFASPVANGSPYSVTVHTQPADQSCSIVNGSGTVAGVDVTNIGITCATDTYTVGGTVAGLVGTVVLQNNGGDNLTVSANGAFTFSTAPDTGSAYAVTVLSQPVGQTCAVANGTGTVAGAHVTNISVACAINTYVVGGTVSGLSGSVVLQNNGGDDLTVSTNGSFTFGTALYHGGNYVVTVLSQPAGQACTVQQGAGTLGSDVNDVVVACHDVYSIGGTVSGLSGSMVLKNNGGDDLSVSANGPFGFATRLDDGVAYAVTVATQPVGQRCTVTSGSGTVTGNSVTSVNVSCVNLYTIGGTITGLDGTGMVLQNNNGDDLSITGTGTVNFTFDTAIVEGSAYNVTVLSRPANPLQNCLVSGGSGSVSGSNITNVAITCSLAPTYSISGRVIGLSGSGLVLQNNGGGDITVTGSGTKEFTFLGTLNDGDSYDVTVASQPNNPNEICNVVNGSGVMAGADITNVLVHCPLDFSWSHPLPQGNNIQNIRWINNRYMAVGENGTVMSSIDGDVWTVKNIAAVPLSDIAWTGNQYVAVGYKGAAYTSSDGESWTSQTTGTTSYLSGVAWASDRIIAVGDSGTIIGSADGVSWSTYTSGTTKTLSHVIWHPSRSEVLVVGDSVVLYSTIGSTSSWVPVLTGSGWGANGIVWTGSQYVAVGYVCGGLCVWPGSGGVLRSSNGASWSALQTLSLPGLRKVTWTGSQLVAVGGNNIIATSTNGTTWVQRGFEQYSSLTGVAWNGSNRVITMGDGGKTMTSADGISWISSPSVTRQQVTAIRSNGSQYIAVGGGMILGTLNTEAVVLTSSDGISDWVSRNAGTNKPLLDAVWTGSFWVAVGQSGTIVTSQDGINWTARSSGTTSQLNRVYWDGAQLFALGNGGVILHSQDGIVWSPRTSGTTNNLFAMTNSPTQHVITGANVILTSTNNGENWNIQTSYESLGSVVWTGSLFVAGGGSGSTGKVLISQDALSWSVQNFGSNDFVYNLVWNGHVAALQAGSKIYVSPDGLSWSSQSRDYYGSISWHGDRLYVSGSNGAILYSE